MAVTGKKVFVGSLPDCVQDYSIREAFAHCGIVEDVFVKPGCEPGRQWAFVTFQTMEQAQYAKATCDRVLMLPGADRPVDVMPAKNQGMFGQQDQVPVAGPPIMPMQQQTPPRKIFVGSLPDGTSAEAVHAEFGKYGSIEDVFLKEGCEPGRQWAFVLYADHTQAQYALDMTNGVLTMPGGFRPCEVTLARNQGMFGKDSLQGGMATQQAALGVPQGPKKIFVGSLPDSINEPTLRAEFSRYGEITDVFIKMGQAPNRQWAFLTFAHPHQAESAKVSCDRILHFQGSDQACEVTFARHQGMFGTDEFGNNLEKMKGSGKGGGGYSANGIGVPVGAAYAINAPVAYAPAPVQYAAVPQCAAVAAAAPTSGEPRKIFVGSLPDSITETVLRAEYSKYGHVVDVFLKQGCESNRQWAFITFASVDQAQWAKNSTDRILIFPGSNKACEVMIARNQGKFGHDSTGMDPGGAAMTQAYSPAPAMAQPSYGGCPAGPPPPPSAPPPAHLTPWRQYKTAAGLPYYHNHTTGVTQWEAPPELQASPVGNTAAHRFAPY